jgi:hypothetical protein
VKNFFPHGFEEGNEPMAKSEEEDGEIHHKSGDANTIEQEGGEDEHRGMALAHVGQKELQKQLLYRQNAKIMPKEI